MSGTYSMKISGYTIRRRLGSGGQAVVYLAMQESLQRQVALKVLHPVHSASPEFTARFLNEARILANLGHSNVITIHDIGVEGELHFLSMELVEGGDLKRRMREGLDEDTVLEHLTTIADCLATAHEQHIVHRDIKPGNVLFRRDGTLLLTDFGIAKKLDDESDLTVSGTTLGSPHYLSPEQAQGRPLDGRADIYSLGAMAFELLTGHKPYSGGSEIDTIFRHINAPTPELPERLSRYQELINRTMAKSPDDRFDNASMVVEYLKQLRYDAFGLNVRLPLPGSAVAVNGPRGDDSPTEVFPAASLGFARLRQQLGTPAVFACALTLLACAWLVFQQGDSYAIPEQPQVLLTPEMLPGKATSALETASFADREATQRRPRSNNPRHTEDAAVAVSAPVVPTEPESLPDRASQVRGLLLAGERAFEESRLSIPSGDSALDYYQQVLELDPGNKQANIGLDRIGDRYAQLAEKALSRNERDRAEQFVARGIKVQPDHMKLAELERSLAQPQPDEERVAVTFANTPFSEASTNEQPPGAQKETEIRGESPQQLWRRIQGWFK